MTRKMSHFGGLYYLRKKKQRYLCFLRTKELPSPNFPNSGVTRIGISLDAKTFSRLPDVAVLDGYGSAFLDRGQPTLRRHDCYCRYLQSHLVSKAEIESTSRIITPPSLESNMMTRSGRRGGR